ncbi:hypothetical protein Tco_0827011 [Tanacetum coccineum]
MSRRKWTAIDRKRSGLMIELIDKQIRERRIIKNLERLVGARELEMDYKLMTRTDDLEVFSTKDPGLDWIFAHNFLTRLQKLSPYASGHLEVFEKATCLEKASFSFTPSHVEVS